MDIKNTLSNPILLFVLGLVLQFAGGLILSGVAFVILLIVLWETKKPILYYVLGAIVGFLLTLGVIFLI